MSSSKVLLLCAALVVGGCSKKADAEKTDPQGGGVTTTTTPKGVDWSKVERVPITKLKGLLPDTLNGLKRTEHNGRTVPDGDGTWTEASADYTGPKDAHLSILVKDSPREARELVAAKMAAWKGYPVVREEDGAEHSELGFVVGDRFVVEGKAEHLTSAQLKAALEKVDLAKLASWKNDGVK